MDNSKKETKRLLKNQYMREYRSKNFDQLKEYRKKMNYRYKEKSDEYKKVWYQENKEKIKKSRKNYYKENKKTILEKQKIYVNEHKESKREYINNYNINKRKKDVNFRIIGALRSRLNRFVKKKNRSVSTLGLVGCSLEDLIKHLESQFKERMTWDNYGKVGWHIDHIIPCSSFELFKEDQQKICFNYKNLQPLWWWENISKGNKLPTTLKINYHQIN